MSGLDPLGRKEIRDLILRLHGEGKTVFMNTHILSDVEMLCDRVAIIVKGRIRYEGRIEDFLGDAERRSEVVLSGVAPDLVESFEERFGAEVRGRGERIEFSVRQKDVPELIRAALDLEVEVLSVTPHRVSLETVFLSAVEQERNAEAERQTEGQR
jgi:ABC-2 type transport system ATP-binding protein